MHCFQPIVIKMNGMELKNELLLLYFSCTVKYPDREFRYFCRQDNEFTENEKIRLKIRAGFCVCVNLRDL